MKYFIFSKLNRNHFLFLSHFAITIILDIVKEYIYLSNDLIFSFNKSYIYSLSDFLTLIPVIIIKKRSKSISKENQESFKNDRTVSNIDIKYIYTDNNKRRKKRIIKLHSCVNF